MAIGEMLLAPNQALRYYRALLAMQRQQSQAGGLGIGV
jgi:hypothetical protein